MRATLIQIDGEQVLLLPPQFAYPDGCELEIVRVGDTIRMWPATLTNPPDEDATKADPPRDPSPR